MTPGLPVGRARAGRRLFLLAPLAVLGACANGRPDGDAPPEPPASSPAVASPMPTSTRHPSPRVTGAKPASGRGGAVAAIRGRAMLGAYLDLAKRTLASSLALRRKQLKRDERIVHFFLGWQDDFPTEDPGLPSGAILMITWRGTHYDRITDGSCDDLIATAGRRLARYGKPVLLRWGWEMNGDWYDWGGADNDRDTAGYITAWRRVHRIVGEQGAQNVSWVWSPNWNSQPDQAWNDLRHYYPGDRYVDWVGVSGYNLGEETPQQLFGDLYAIYAAHKPIMIAEVGAVDRGGRSKADWINALTVWVRAHPEVGAVVWFDTDTHPGAPENWRIDTDPATLAAYRAMANDPAFSG